MISSPAALLLSLLLIASVSRHSGTLAVDIEDSDELQKRSDYDADDYSAGRMNNIYTPWGKRGRLTSLFKSPGWGKRSRFGSLRFGKKSEDRSWMESGAVIRRSRPGQPLRFG